MGEAKALYGRGDFEQSRLKYVEACSIARTDNCVRSLAVAELAAGRPADAYVHFQEVAKGAAAVRLDPRAARELNELVQEAYGKSGHVEVVAPVGTLLSVDDKSAGAVPSEAIAVDPGTHTFEGQRGERHKRVTQDAPAGKVVRVVFKEEDLVPAAVIAAPVGPVTTVTTSTTPVAGVDAEAQTKTWPPVGAWVLGGIGLVGIGTGIGFAVDRSRKNSDVANAGTACATPGASVRPDPRRRERSRPRQSARVDRRRRRRRSNRRRRDLVCGCTKERSLARTGRHRPWSSRASVSD